MKNKYKKIMKNIDKIKKVSGFVITAPGDESVGIFSSSWKIEGDFFFDNQEECDEFKKDLNYVFENYCGEIVEIITFEEYQTMIDLENKL